MKYLFFILFIGLTFIETRLNAQCNAGVPSFTVDLSYNPNATWISPDTIRNDFCCGASSPDKCVEFVVTLHPDAEGIIFDIYSGAVPPGALFYQVDCGPPTMVGEPLCLSGAGPHNITFCKPGNNSNEYSITSVAEPGVGPDISVNDGCFGAIYAIGYEPTSISWTSVFPGAQGSYDNYLDCTTCDSVNVVAQPSFPTYVDFQICGYPLGGCDTVFICDTVRSYFNSTLAANITPLNPTVCYGTTGTTITANGLGGTPPYNYLWNTGDTSQSIFINVGTYYLTLGDSSGCPPTTDTVVVTSFASAITANAGSDQIVCSDNTPVLLSGSVVAASGGVWSGGNGTFSPNDSTLNASYFPTSQEITNGSVELYLTTTGNGTCPADMDTVMISLVKFNASINFSVNNVSCTGGNDGSATILLSGGVSPFTITWNTVPVQTGITATGLATGSYTVNLADGNNCDTIISFTITEPQPLVANISGNIAVSCFGGNDGSATVSVTGGTLPYAYLWDATTGGQTDSVVVGLFAGSYGVLVTDANGCQDSTSVTITEPASSISLTFATTAVSCYGGNDGTATANPTGGTPPYTYVWDATTGGQTDSIAVGLTAGTYGVTVYDLNDCIYEPSIIVSEPAPLAVVTSSTGVSCFGGNDGTATVSISGGTSPYNVLWDASTGSQTDTTATNLIAGAYQANITDFNGCFVDTVVTVSQPLAALSLNTSVVNLKCFGDADGSATVTINGGTSPYTILWDAATGSQTDTMAIGLEAGNYGVLITDVNGCKDSVGVILTEPQPLVANISGNIAVSCFGGNDGSATVSVTGGTLPYAYLWDATTGGQTDSVVVGLFAGSYGVLVTDANGCQDSTSVTITEPNPLVLSISPNDTICQGTSTIINASATGGNGGNIFSWNQGLPNSSIHTVSPLIETNYVATVTDSKGCVGNIDSVTISVYYLNLSGLVVSSAGDVCEGVSTTVIGNYSGGLGTVTFQWNQGLGNNLGTFTVVPNDTTDYILTVTNQCSNTIADTVTVNTLPYPIIDLPVIYDEGCSILSVNFTDSINNVTNMIYLWEFGDGTTSTVSNPSHTYENAGTYLITLEVTSLQGCKSVSSNNSVVNVFPKPTALFSANPEITDTQNPTITFSNQSLGGIENLWDFGNGATSLITNPVYIYEDTGTYMVQLIITNQFGCIDTYQAPIIIEPFYTFDIPNAFTPSTSGGNGGQYDPTSLLNDIFYPTTEYVDEFHMMIFNRWGELIFESFDINIGWDGYYRGNMAQQDVYVWKIDIIYVDGKQLSKVGDLTLIR